MTSTVLFLCPHHAAKSVIAEAYFNQLVTKRQLAFEGISAGTEPDATVSQVVVKMLDAEGIDVSQHKPQRFTSQQLANAKLIVSMGCTADELGIPAERVEMWNDVPPVSQNPEAAQTAIRSHVEALVDQLGA